MPVAAGLLARTGGRGAGTGGPEENPGLVDEGQVGRRPGDVPERVAAGSLQQGLLLGRQQPLAGQGDEGRRAVEVVDQLLGQEPGPHAVEGGHESEVAPQRAGHVLLHELLGRRHPLDLGLLVELGPEPDATEEIGHVFLALPPALHTVHQQRLSHEIEQRHAGIERGEGILKDHLHLPTQRP